MPVNRDDRYNALAAVRAFDEAAVDLPDDVLALAERLRELTDLHRPVVVDQRAIAELYANGAPEATIAVAVAAHVGTDARQQAWRQAQQIVGRRLLNAIFAARDQLHAVLAKEAEVAINALQAAVKINQPVVDLVRHGRHDDAAIVAGADSAAVRYGKLADLREYLTRGSSPFSAGHVNCKVWRDPRVVEGKIKNASGADYYLTGLRCGGVLWFPANEQAQEVAEEMRAEWSRAEQVRRSAQHGVGSVTAWT